MRKVSVELGAPYDILIGRGLLQRAGELARPVLRASKIAIVTDTNVNRYWAESAERAFAAEYGAENVFKFVLPAGEKNKNAKNYLKIIDLLAKNSFARTDAIVALGGGVIGDTAGFAAATYMRGIDFVQIPTTLLAMIDSSVGGKTGVDLSEGKNLLGAFHQPRLVIADPDALGTLSEEEYENGLGEGVKYAVIEPEIAPFLLKNRTDVESFVQKCVRLKADIVGKDEKEGGVRRILNLGHTVGHALEADSEFEIPHGIAVAEGISVMTRAALTAGEISKERAESIFGLLSLVGVGRASARYETLKKYVGHDKKAESESINAVVVTDSGAAIKKFGMDEFLHYVCKIDIKTQRSRLEGEITLPASKSLAHRYLIASYLAGGEMDVEGGEDVEATKRCLSALKLCKRFGGKRPLLQVGESGSTLRFLLPVVCALGVKARFLGEGRIGERPIEGLIAALETHGPVIERKKGNRLCLAVGGKKLRAGEYVVDGSVSSQYVTGLMMALPLLDGDSTLTVTGKAASASYIELTLNVLRSFGINVEREKNVYRIAGGQKYVMPKSADVEGDWSSAGYLLAAGALAGEMRISGASENSAQGDRITVDLLRRAGADITRKDGMYISKRSQLRGIDFDAADCPDIVPVMATALSFADGVSRISSVDRLRDKESDRLAAVRALLESFGVETEYGDDVLTIYGKSRHVFGEYPAFCDHRIAMSAIVAALCTEGECVVRGAECIRKSYPSFIEDMKRAGADIKIF